MAAPQEHAAARRRRLRRAAAEVAATQSGVVSRRQLKRLGVSRWQIRAETQAGRWRSHGRHTVAVHTADLAGEARWRWAVFETGGGAALAGPTALEAAGLQGYDEPVHVVVRKSQRHHRPRGVVVHETRRLLDATCCTTASPDCVPRWPGCSAHSGRGRTGAGHGRQPAPHHRGQAGGRADPCTPGQTATAAAGHRAGRRRRCAVEGELDFVRLCRRYGLPEPSRQVLRRGPRGRIYLDVYWDRWRLVVEIEGIHHDAPENAVPDALRQNSVSITTGTVLRVPLLGLRTECDAFMGQVADALRLPVRRCLARPPDARWPRLASAGVCATALVVPDLRAA